MGSIGMARFPSVWRVNRAIARPSLQQFGAADRYAVLMIDHIEIKVRDLAASVRFYAAVLAPLGYTQRVDGAAKGFGDGATLDLFLVSGEPDQDHFAFRAATRELVRACWTRGEAFGALDRAPALAPHIHPNYYAGYLRDPDGRLVELVCHEPDEGGDQVAAASGAR
jgi:catechol 2,3-dioxygenase-like lactoylglutathione lyase family enzyme